MVIGRVKSGFDLPEFGCKCGLSNGILIIDDKPKRIVPFSAISLDGVRPCSVCNQSVGAIAARTRLADRSRKITFSEMRGNMGVRGDGTNAIAAAGSPLGYWAANCPGYRSASGPRTG